MYVVTLCRIKEYVQAVVADHVQVTIHVKRDVYGVLSAIGPELQICVSCVKCITDRGFDNILFFLILAGKRQKH